MLPFAPMAPYKWPRTPRCKPAPRQDRFAKNVGWHAKSTPWPQAALPGSRNFKDLESHKFAFPNFYQATMRKIKNLAVKKFGEAVFRKVFAWAAFPLSSCSPVGMLEHGKHAAEKLECPENDSVKEKVLCLDGNSRTLLPRDANRRAGETQSRRRRRNAVETGAAG